MTHAGVKTCLSQHFIKTGILSADHAWTFKELFSRRQASDYEDFIYNTLSDYELLHPCAESFVRAVEDLVYLKRNE